MKTIDKWEKIESILEGIYKHGFENGKENSLRILDLPSDELTIVEGIKRISQLLTEERERVIKEARDIIGNGDNDLINHSLEWNSARNRLRRELLSKIRRGKNGGNDYEED